MSALSNLFYIVLGILLPISVFVLPVWAWGWTYGGITALVFAGLFVLRIAKITPRILGLPLMVAISGVAIYTLAASYGVLGFILPVIYYAVAYVLTRDRKAE